MSDEYELEALLEIRQRELDEAERQVARAQRILAAAEESLREQQAHLRSQRQERHRSEEAFSSEMASGQLSSGEVQAFGRYRQRLMAQEEALERDVHEAKDALQQAQSEVEKRRAQMREAIRQLKAVEGHREKWEARRQQAAMRKAGRQMDEVASRIWRGG